MNEQFIYLRNYLNGRFNESELHDLCYDLGVDYENLSAQTKSDRIRELILYMQRHRRLEELVTAIQKNRGELLDISIEQLYGNEVAGRPFSGTAPPNTRYFFTSPKFISISAFTLLSAIFVFWLLREQFTLNQKPTDVTTQISQVLDSSCSSLEVGPLITGKSRIQPGSHMPVIVHIINHEDLEITYSWRADCGDMSPGIDTRIHQSTYIAPKQAVSDKITVHVITGACGFIERTETIIVNEGNALDMPNDCVPSTQPTATRTSPLPPEPVIFEDYVIQPGDTLYRITLQANTSVGLMARHNINEESLVPDTVVQLPIANPSYCPGRQPYIVREDDSFFSIARAYDISIEELQDINNIDENYTLFVATIICVP